MSLTFLGGLTMPPTGMGFGPGASQDPGPSTGNTDRLSGPSAALEAERCPHRPSSRFQVAAAHWGPRLGALGAACGGSEPLGPQERMGSPMATTIIRFFMLNSLVQDSLELQV